MAFYKHKWKKLPDNSDETDDIYEPEPSRSRISILPRQTQSLQEQGQQRSMRWTPFK